MVKETAQKILRQLSALFPETPFRVQYWTGESETFGVGEPRFTLRAKTLAAAERILRDGSLGFGETYMDGDIEIEGQIQEFLKFYTAFDYVRLSWREKLSYALSLLRTRNTVEGAKQNVARHYDLSNDFYRLWLDRTMTYTCAYFRHVDDTLEMAQNNKHEHICRKLRLQAGQTLVDIGCGWGAMMFYAAEHYGVTCTGYTISEEQYQHVQAEIKRRGMEGRVRIFLQDYREVAEQYDRFVSIGMFEQVGKKYIRVFFDGVKRMLKPGGTGLLHTIGATISTPNDAWVEKYIFPGGYLPTLAELAEPMGKLDLNIHDVEDLRLHYAQTLNHWLQRVHAHETEIVQMYERKFMRMWTLYLNMSATAFTHGGIRLYQLAFTNGLDNHMPRTREYLYRPESLERFGQVDAPKPKLPLPRMEKPVVIKGVAKELQP